MRELRNHTAQLIEAVSEGGVVIVTRHGHPVAELRAIGSAAAPPIHPNTATVLSIIARRGPYDSGLAAFVAAERLADAEMEREPWS